jgi:hypothetical protein
MIPLVPKSGTQRTNKAHSRRVLGCKTHLSGGWIMRAVLFMVAVGVLGYSPSDDVHLPRQHSALAHLGAAPAGSCIKRAGQSSAFLKWSPAGFGLTGSIV